MSSNSKIEWTDKTWNPVTGCTKVSQGCKNCYAETFYERFHGKGSFRNVICHEDRLAQPLQWKKPSMIFVNSMSDLFHEDVPFEFIHKVFVIMKAAYWHTFQILTKRADRMLEYFSADRPQKLDDASLSMMNERIYDIPSMVCYVQEQGIKDFAPKNIWLGVSVEDQKSASERVLALSTVPAKVRFLSCEPLLGPVSLYPYLNLTVESRTGQPGSAIDWVIAGGESGHSARPMHPDWVRSLRDQCQSANVPFFFKQWGQWAPHPNPPQEGIYTGAGIFLQPNGNWVEQGQWWSVKAQAMDKVGKKKAGRLLDGVLHDEFPVKILQP
jgi:protein gp37